MKTLYNNTYPAYKQSYKGIDFLVFKVMTGNMGSVAKWYLHFENYYINEKDSSEEFNTKKQCIEIARYHIDKKQTSSKTRFVYGQDGWGEKDKIAWKYNMCSRQQRSTKGRSSRPTGAKTYLSK